MGWKIRVGYGGKMTANGVEIEGWWGNDRGWGGK